MEKVLKNYLVTGDTHGRVLERLGNIDTEKYNPEDTAVIILGDAGINFWLNKTDRNLKRNIQNTGFTLYCVRGNHEERPENLPNVVYTFDTNIKNYVIIESEYPNIRYLRDGYDYQINGKTALVIGGAYSVDKWYRLNRAGVFDKLDPNYTNSKKTGWFPAEQLTDDELEQIECNHTGMIYDVVLTHTCPISWEPKDLFLPGLDQSTIDKSMEIWLDDFKNHLDWTIWLFGHYHDDRLIRPGVEMYYRDIEDWNDIMKRWEDPEHLDWWLKKDPNYEAGL